MEDGSSFKEYQNLLEDVEKSAIKDSERKSWQKYARLVLPHVGLVIFVCFYAVCGAWVFYSIESPHEDRLKVHGIKRVQDLRRQLVKDLMEMDTESGRPVWMTGAGGHMRRFGEDIFRSYKEQYVRYEDVRPISTLPQQPQQPAQPADPRFRRHFSKSRSEGKMWTPSSALFFAATTMATIGYGNIVPMTSQGRVACILFALFGAPLAIITIGDLGKFLSECTIWLYRKLKDKSRLYQFQLNQFWVTRKKRRRRRLKEQLVADELAMDGDLELGNEDVPNGNLRVKEEKERQKIAKAEREWVEEQKMETEVPVLIVFTILLLYIALGGVLFALLESWTYMDAFYYCFVSLTTIGFGDLVPDRHEYIVLMLLYLGIGLAVTTMCIDLVGVQYIQKIHYFGRKFQGTDIRLFLRKKRMLERRFAMGGDKEFIEYVIKQEREAMNPMVQPRAIAQPVMHMASQLHDRDQPEEEKLSLRSEQQSSIWPMEEFVIQEILPANELAIAHELSIPEILEPKPLPPRRLSSPTITGSSESERTIMYSQQRHSGRADSWAESGPSVSLESSVPSTDPSVRQREHLYDNFRSPQPSLSSFAFNFPPPSPDYWKIADEARSARRLASCPLLPPFEPPEPVRRPIWRRWRTLASPSRALHELLRFSRRCVVIVHPFQSLSRRFSRAQNLESNGEGSGKSTGNGNGLEEMKAMETIHHLDMLRRRVSFVDQRLEILQAPKPQHPRYIGQPVWYYRRRRSLIQQQQQQLTAEPSSLLQLPTEQPTEESSAALPAQIPIKKTAIPLFEYQPVLKRKRRERLARRYDPLNRLDWLALSPRIAVTEEGIPATMAEISERAQELSTTKDLPKELASEHPIYQHLAELEQLAEVVGPSTSFEAAAPMSGRLIFNPPRHSIESLMLSLKAARRWKAQAKKRKSEVPEPAKPMTSQRQRAAQSGIRRMSLGGVALTPRGTTTTSSSSGDPKFSLLAELPSGNGGKSPKDRLREPRGSASSQSTAAGGQSPRMRKHGQQQLEKASLVQKSGKTPKGWRQMSTDAALGLEPPSEFRALALTASSTSTTASSTSAQGRVPMPGRRPSAVLWKPATPVTSKREKDELKASASPTAASSTRRPSAAAWKPATPTTPRPGQEASEIERKQQKTTKPAWAPRQ